MDETPTRGHSVHWGVRWTAVVAAAVFCGLGPLLVMAKRGWWFFLPGEVGSGDYIGYPYVVVMFLLPFYAIPTWRYSRSNALGWVSLLFPVLYCAGFYWPAFVWDLPGGPWIWPIGTFLGNLALAVGAWLAMADDEGRLRTLPRRLVAWLGIATAAFYGIAAAIVYDRRLWTDSPPSAYNVAPNGQFEREWLWPMSDWVLGIVLPVAVSVLVFFGARAERGAPAVVRWLVFALVVLATIAGAIGIVAPDAAPLLGQISAVLDGPLNNALLPGLVAVALWLAARRERRLTPAPSRTSG